MRHILMISAALAALGVAIPAQAQKLDNSGRCVGPTGHFMKADACVNTPKPFKGKLDAKGVCRAPDGRTVEKELCTKH